MRAQIQEAIKHLGNVAEELHDYGETSVARSVEGIANDLEAAIRPQWVPVAERLPEQGVEVFGLCFGGVIEIVRWSAQWQRFLYETDVCADGVTHWHEIDYPEPPAN